MANFVRYVIAVLCFAASAGCLALWGRSATQQDVVVGPTYLSTSRGIMLDTVDEVVVATTVLERPSSPNRKRFNKEWKYLARPEVAMAARREQLAPMFERSGQFLFSLEDEMAYFPLWYPALVFALTGVGVLRFRRQFTIRAALICGAVVAALLGMFVAL